MKWLFIFLLVINVAYMGWEIDHQTRINLNNRKEALPVPRGVDRLVLVRELNKTPETKSANNDSPDIETVDTDISEAAKTAADIQTGVSGMTNDVKIEQEIVNLLVSQLPDISTRSISNNLSETQQTCFSYGPFPDDQQTADLIAWFEERRINVQQRLEREQENRLFWVYLAQQESRSSAIKAIEDLKSKGIRDYRLIETGDLRNAISLGLFSTQAAVNRRLNELKDRGYQPVVVPYRDAKMVYWVDIKLSSQTDVMSEMFTGFPARYNSVPVNCTKIAQK
ncbi:MAG: SPOR domain-containing protein [Gammaproteobacteria bacterium]|nr:SPOR domain-containing protein [Gammaproteobacteria bacterium]NIQ11877.1 SPOR domain-containing protein [Gammaproteobacteria bacterium]NIQ74449.1 SPOR domain-containing protein [Gammaproteobacteria bacterium]NIR26448.1 SPOR domain-containing protein [Gammaproteobacteria bacterium]NIR95617.1 SPOR domain-containing protein [Gammaproteobacteria bacterium]